MAPVEALLTSAIAQEERVEDAAAAAELEAAQAGPKKWGLKRSREGEGDALRYGGAAV